MGTGGDGSWVALWQTSGTDGLPVIAGVRSVDAGATWPETFAASSSSAQAFHTLSVEADASGDVVALFGQSYYEGDLPYFDLLVMSAAATTSARGTLRGTVYDQDTMDPLSCAAVIIEDMAGKVITVATVGVDGSFYVGNLPAVDVNVLVQAPGYVSDIQTIHVPAEQEGELDIFLEPGAVVNTVTGRVLEQDSPWPLAGALVIARQNDVVIGKTYTCAEGYFEIALPVLIKQAGSITLEITAPNFEMETREVAPGENVTVEMKSAVSLPNQVLGVITKTSDDSPLVGCQVVVKEVLGTLGFPRTTDDDGAYTVANIADGEYEVTASADGYETETTTVILGGGSTIGRADLALTKVGGDGNGNGGGCGPSRRAGPMAWVADALVLGFVASLLASRRRSGQRADAEQTR
jgi:hypothetical protein